MAAISRGVGKLQGAIDEGDFEAVSGLLSRIEGNWPAVRSELDLRGEVEAANSFEGALQSLQEASDDGDQEASKEAAQGLSAALGKVKDVLATIDADPGRILSALVLPALLVVAVTVAVSAFAKRAGIRQ